MQEHGLKISELVTLFNLEVLNRGSDYDTALLTITDVNRPGLQFHSFYDYFDPRRLQVLGKAEITYLKGSPRSSAASALTTCSSMTSRPW